MISIDLKITDALLERRPDTNRLVLTLGGMDERDDPSQVQQALRMVTARRVRIIVLEDGEEFPDLPKARKPHEGPGADPFA